MLLCLPPYLVSLWPHCRSLFCQFEAVFFFQFHKNNFEHVSSHFCRKMFLLDACNRMATPFSELVTVTGKYTDLLLGKDRLSKWRALTKIDCQMVSVRDPDNFGGSLQSIWQKRKLSVVFVPMFSLPFNNATCPWAFIQKLLNKQWFWRISFSW